MLCAMSVAGICLGVGKASVHVLKPNQTGEFSRVSGAEAASNESAHIAFLNGKNPVALAHGCNCFFVAPGVPLLIELGKISICTDDRLLLRKGLSCF
jgi:hypothetical protein